MKKFLRFCDIACKESWQRRIGGNNKKALANTADCRATNANEKFRKKAIIVQSLSIDPRNLCVLDYI